MKPESIYTPKKLEYFALLDTLHNQFRRVHKAYQKDKWYEICPLDIAGYSIRLNASIPEHHEILHKLADMLSDAIDALDNEAALQTYTKEDEE
jgi:hypothetical protein